MVQLCLAQTRWLHVKTFVGTGGHGEVHLVTIAISLVIVQPPLSLSNRYALISHQPFGCGCFVGVVLVV